LVLAEEDGAFQRELKQHWLRLPLRDVDRDLWVATDTYRANQAHVT
jgi:hypothetical protein